MAQNNDNNYFTFLGVRYEGNFNDAWSLYAACQNKFNTFSEYLKENAKIIN